MSRKHTLKALYTVATLALAFGFVITHNPQAYGFYDCLTGAVALWCAALPAHLLAWFIS